MIVISPAKRLSNNKKADSSLPVTEPIFKDEAKKLASELSKTKLKPVGRAHGGERGYCRA